MDFDQRKNLLPANYKGAMAKYTKGLEIGDPFVDELPIGKLCCHGGSAKAVDELVQSPEPSWVDWDQIERGQELWRNHLGRVVMGLGAALLGGFSIARFAVVLHHNGYAQSAESAFDRYRETSFAMSDWFHYSLRNSHSPARRSIYTVRCMHGFARRRSVALFDKDNGEGVPLSQYDMAEVLLGFSGISLTIIEDEMGVKLDENEVEDMVACWRLIGYHLGIMDEFNVCRSVEEVRACVEDYVAFSPARFKSCRDCTFDLQRTACEGFGLGTGLGSEFWYGVLGAVQTSRGWNIDNMPKKALNGMKEIGSSHIALLGNDRVNAIVSKLFVLNRNDYLNNPEGAKRRLKILGYIAALHDRFVWRIYSFGFSYKRPLLIVLIVVLFRRLLRRFVRGLLP